MAKLQAGWFVCPFLTLEFAVKAHDLSLLDRHKTSGFPRGYPDNYRAFYSPIDDVHGVLAELIDSARRSLVVCMYGFDDDRLAVAIRAKLAHPEIFVQLSLDSSQAEGVHEGKLLREENFPASSVAFGRSEHGAIMHLKLVVIDDEIVISGSTNWSASGEEKQDNVLEIIHNSLVAAEARGRANAIHEHMLAVAEKNVAKAKAAKEKVA
jgi:phosphatidylserine/phosphatidylglycerophosphate/cardiolipin synthase-like enzyme